MAIKVKMLLVLSTILFEKVHYLPSKNGGEYLPYDFFPKDVRDSFVKSGALEVVEVESENEYDQEVLKKLEALDGVGKTTAKRLYDAGLESVELIANADIADIKAINGVGDDTAQEILDSAKKAVGISVDPNSKPEVVPDKEDVSQDSSEEETSADSEGEK